MKPATLSDGADDTASRYARENQDNAASRRIRDTSNRGIVYERIPHELEEQDINATRPPSYYSSDPAHVEGDDERNVSLETRRSDEHKQLNWSKARKSLVARAYWGLPGLVRFSLIVLPGISMFILISRYIFGGGDALGLSANAFVLVAANVGVVILLGLLVDGLTGSNFEKRLQTAHQDTLELAVLAFMWCFFLLWAVSGLILWGAFAAGESNVAERWVQATEFDAKISQHGALAFVTSCLGEMIPGRNASIRDLTACFEKLGVPPIVK
ncbi:hypothetical protein FBEOM_5934 [Fusarium beomiforme]|uniref:Uncharacterized protein n=1 Tax=Fusarium beomiforme TaxID=44412 RepID=A0A9P5AK01_9HYPO|nr:hypothetical protein FBEOM_5934 [Fusarium beomiforme]